MPFVKTDPIIVSPDMSVVEVAAYRGESTAQVYRKIKSGVYVSFLSGDRRYIARESVESDRPPA